MPVFFNPEEIISELALQGTEWVGDFGAGSGNWSIPLAKKLKGGKVFAIEIQEEPLDVLRKRAVKEGLKNIECVKGDIEKPLGTGLPAETLDWVIIVHTLFQTENKDSVLQEAWRVLKKGGKLLILDWKKEALVGPQEGKISEEELREKAQRLGFKEKRVFYPDEFHYALVWEKEE